MTDMQFILLCVFYVIVVGPLSYFVISGWLGDWRRK